MGNNDDMAMIVVAKDLVDVQLYSSDAIIAIKKWLKGVGPLLTVDKKRRSSSRKETIIRIKMGNLVITSEAATE